MITSIYAVKAFDKIQILVKLWLYLLFMGSVLIWDMIPHFWGVHSALCVSLSALLPVHPTYFDKLYVHFHSVLCILKLYFEIVLGSFIPNCWVYEQKVGHSTLLVSFLIAAGFFVILLFRSFYWWCVFVFLSIEVLLEDYQFYWCFLKNQILNLLVSSIAFIFNFIDCCSYLYFFPSLWFGFISLLFFFFFFLVSYITDLRLFLISNVSI